MKFCKKCGNQLEDRAKFCVKCGTKTDDGEVPYARQTFVTHENTQKQQGGMSGGMITLMVTLLIVVAAAIGTLCFVAIRGRDADDIQTQEVTKNTAMPTASPKTKKTQETPTPTAYSYPVFSYATASATTEATKSSRDYAADLVLDGRSDTAWNFTGTSGEWIRIYSGGEQHVRGIKILSGYCKYSPDYGEWLYYKNNRPHNITVSFSSGLAMSYSLDDTFDSSYPVYQTIDFGETIETTYVQISVDSVYRGNTWNDTAISEISPY